MGEDALLQQQFRLLQGERLTRVVSFFTVGILDAVISITVFGLYFFRRSDREYLWFAIILLTSALQAALTITDFILNFPLGIGDFLAETFGALWLAASLLFFSRVLEAKRSLLWRAVLLLALLDPLNVALYQFRLTPPATSTSLRILFDVPIEIYILVLLFGRAIAGNRNARLLFVPTIFMYGTGILGGLLLLSFQIGWWSHTLASINQWNVVEAPFPIPLQVFVQLIFIVALLVFLIRRFAMSRAQEERYSADLEAARTLQQVLIPEALPSISNLEISTAYHPAQEVGGDFYQILQLPITSPDAEPDILVVLGDVAGKGLPAAMTVSLLVGAIRSIVETSGSPAEILAGLNRRLLGRGSGFTTCLAIRFTPSGTTILANAGHIAPYRNGQEISSPPALPLGLDPNAAFSEESFQLLNGDRLTLLTDGVPEATCRGELFGFERAARLSTTGSLPTNNNPAGKPDELAVGATIPKGAVVTVGKSSPVSCMAWSPSPACENPSIVTGLEIIGSGPPPPIEVGSTAMENGPASWLLILKSILSLQSWLFESMIACLNEPEPESLVFVTRQSARALVARLKNMSVERLRNDVFAISVFISISFSIGEPRGRACSGPFLAASISLGAIRWRKLAFNSKNILGDLFSDC